jgi:hypothetical protein
MHMNSILTGFDYMSKKSLKIPKGGNQNPYIEEEQTTQWPKEKVQTDKQRSTKHTNACRKLTLFPTSKCDEYFSRTYMQYSRS